MSTKFLERQGFRLTGVFGSLLAVMLLLAVTLAPAAAQSERTLTIGLNSVQDSLDVHTAIGPNVPGTRIYGLFHDTLLQPALTGELKPVLATGWENDGLEWHFYTAGRCSLS